ESQSAEKALHKLTTERAEKQEALTVAREELALLERLAMQAADCAAAAEQVCIAEREVARIRKMDCDVDAAQARVASLLEDIAKAEQALQAARERYAAA